MTKYLENYGYYLGLAFQITDDILDYNSCEEKLGKINHTFLFLNSFIYKVQFFKYL